MNTTFNNQREKTKKIVMIGMLSSICIFLGLTGLGFIIVPPSKATIMHIPVIIGALVEGPIVGALVGLVFGIFSIYQAITAPTVTSFILLNPIISILPRILIGLTSYYIYKLALQGVKKNSKLTFIFSSFFAGFLSFLLAQIFIGFNISTLIGITVSIIFLIFLFKYNNIQKEKIITIGLAATVGTLTNTIGVLGLTYLIYLDKFALAINVPSEIAGGSIFTIGLTNGIPEIIVSVLITVPVVVALQKIRKK